MISQKQRSRFSLQQRLLSGRNQLSSGVLAVCLLTAGCSSPKGPHVLNQRPNDPLLSGQIIAKVLIFVSNDCPIANRYSPEIRRMHAHYAPQGVAFWLVHSDPGETAASVRAHDLEYGLKLPVLLDSDQNIAQMAKAELVPSAAVFTPNGGLVYHGRIDDRFAELGRERPEPTHHDLLEALDAVLAHRPVAVAETKPVGCYIPHRR